MSEKNISSITGSKTVEELVLNYDDTLRYIVIDQRLAMTALQSWITGFAFRGVELGDYLNDFAQKVGDALSDSSKQARASIAVYPEVLKSLSDFTDIDKQWLARASRPDNDLEQAKVMVSHNATDHIARTAMQATFDIKVLGKAFHASKNYEQTLQTMRLASSDAANGAMRTVLDHDLYKNVLRLDIPLKSVPAKITRYVSDRRNVGTSMLSAVDSRVFDKAMALGRDTPEARRIIDLASSIQAKTILLSEFNEVYNNAANEHVFDNDIQNSPSNTLPRELGDASNVVDLLRFRAGKNPKN